MPIPKYYVRPDGLHESIITVNGKRKAFRGKTDREVWNKIKSYRAEAEKPKTVPFSDVSHAWWNEIEPTLAPNSLRNYSPAYERAVAQFGPEDVATITSKEVETYINQFAKTHAKKTVITQRQIIRQILNKAQRGPCESLACVFHKKSSGKSSKLASSYSHSAASPVFMGDISGTSVYHLWDMLSS